MNRSGRVAIIGVTGFIGRGLPQLLASHGFEVTGVSRRGAANLEDVDQWQTLDRMDFSGIDAVINMAGEPINRRWTKKNQQAFHESRVSLTQRVVDGIRQLPVAERPRLLINGSAVGIYGDRGDAVLTEQSAHGEGYLADLCRDWELAAQDAESLGVRVVLLRTGVVLGKGGAAFENLLRVFKFGLGGKLGAGRQWMPWIHVDDLRAAVVHALLCESVRGPLNGVAAYPERNAAFTKKLAKALHRPAVLPVPAFALKLVLGGFGGALLASQNVRPDLLESSGFSFRFPDLESALADLTS